MIEARVVDALSAVNQVIHVVQRVKISDGGNSVLLEQLRMHLDDIPRLRLQTDDVHAPGKGLQIRGRAGGSPHAIHHLEGVFIAVEV